MRAFFISIIGSFTGKIIATIVIAITAALGIGPERWAEFLLGIDKPWIVPVRVTLSVFAAFTFAMLTFSIYRSRPIASHTKTRNWRIFRWPTSLIQSGRAQIICLWQLYGPGDYEAPKTDIGVGRPYYPAYTESQIEFGRRFADAFPGTRGLLTLESTPEIISRLEVLLRSPLTASPPDRSAEANPIYWTAGPRNLHINRYHHYKRSIILINEMELRPVFLAAIGGSVYWQSYVYLESEALPPRRIRGEEDIKNPEYQEFAIYNGKLFNRREYDDGGYMRSGKPIRFSHPPDGRSRWMTPHGFLIVASGSSANLPQVDAALEAHIRNVINNRKNIR